MRRITTMLRIAVLAVLFLFSGNVRSQIIWSASGGSSWMTGSNWAGGAVPGPTNIAQFGAVAPGTRVAIKMNASNNNGTNNQAVGTIKVAAGATSAVNIYGTSARGTLTLNGATVDGVPNVVMSAAGSGLYFNADTSPAMRLNIPGTTPRVIVADSSTYISMFDTLTTAAPLTFLGGGAPGVGGGIFEIGGGQYFSGGLTISNADGTQFGNVQLRNENSVLNVPANNITVNNNSSLIIFILPALDTIVADSLTLTLNGFGSQVDFNGYNPQGGAFFNLAASQGKGWNGPIVLASDASIGNWSNGSPFVLAGNISGAGALKLTGSTLGKISIAGSANSWAGGTRVAGGFITIAAGSSIPNSSLVFCSETGVGSFFIFANTSQTIVSLSSTYIPGIPSGGRITLNSGHILTIDQNTNTTYGVGELTTHNSIITGAGALVKTGTGRLTLTSSGHTFSGGLTVTNGELRFNPATTTTVNLASCPVNLNGGRLATTGDTTTAAMNFGVLTLSANSTIDLGSATAHSMSFASSNAAVWTSGTILNITHWTGGYNGTSGTKGKIFIGSSATGITASQLSQIYFTDGSGNVFPAAILSTGEVVPAGPSAAITTTTASFGPFSNAISHPISVSYTSVGTFSGNFRVQLSDSTGAFTPDTTTRIIGSGSTSPISATIAAGTATGSHYRVRVINGSPAMIFGTNNGSDIVITAPVINTPPSFTLSSPQSLTLTQNAAATDIKSLLHVSDADASQTLTWTQLAAPAHGTLVFTGATATTGSTNITPGGTITYQPTAGYSGIDVFKVAVRDGTASDTLVVNVSVTTLGCSTTFVTQSECSDDPINTLTIGGVASVGNNNSAGSCNGTGYYSFATPVRTLAIGSTVTWSATVGNGVYYDGIGIWIDLNNNGTYESTEFVSASSPVTPNTLSPSGSFVMPSGVTGVQLRMRVRSAYQAVPTASQACTNGIGGGYGETENYFVILTGGATSLSATTAQTNLSCNAVCAGSASVTVSGGTAPYAYSWSPSGGTGATATGLCAGSYTCAITDGASATLSKVVTITQPSVITSSLSSITNVSCNGGSNGAATVSASGGTPTYSFSWAPSGGTDAAATGLTAGAYTVSIIDANSCIKTQTVTVTQPSAITSSVAAQSNVTTMGGSDGSASISVSGGTPGYTYSWVPSGGSTTSISGKAAGTYSCSITDANSCTRVQTVTLTEPTNVTPTYTLSSPQTLTVCKNASATDIKSLLHVSDAEAGQTETWTSQSAPSHGTLVVTSATASSGTTNITPGGTITYQPTVGYSGTDAFTIRVSDGTASSDMVINVTVTSVATSVSTITNLSCNGGSNGVATISASGGTAPYTFSWAPSGGTAATATGLTAGSYTVSVADANLCAVTQTVTVTQPSAITSSVASQTNIGCNGNSTGSAAIIAGGGTGTLTYSWAPTGGTGVTATGLIAGTYTCTITDDNSCTRNQTVTITQPAVLAGNITSQTNISCNGGSNGAATVTASGGTAGYTYSWTPTGGTGATASGLTSGIYTVLVTDANLCAITKTVTLTQPSILTANVSSTTNVSCNGGSNGAATVSTTGGTPTYSFSWAPSGGTAATATGLFVGTYTLSIEDANSCTTTQTVTVTEPTVLSSSVSSVTNVSCNGGTNGAATVSVSGGTPNYSFSWAPTGGTAASATGLAAGNYTVTIEDANSCTKTQTVTVSQPTAITSSVSSQTNVDCNGNATGAAAVTASGGTGTLTYSWAPTGGTLATATGLTAGAYTCTITDDNLCEHTQTVTITQPAVLTSNISAQTNVTCHGGNNGAATVLPTGGTTPYNYSWSPIGGTAATGTGFTVGSYTCTVSDNNGCTHDQVAAILEPALPVASISGTTAICKDENADVIINGPAGTSVSYTINGGSPLNALMNANGADTINSGALTATATYALLDITEGTCTYPSTGNAVITVKPFPTVDATTDQSICNGAATTPVIFTGSVSGTLFTWINDDTTTGIPAAASDSITSLTLTNGTIDRVFSKVIVIPSVGGCVGISDTFEIVSNPTPVLSSTLTASPVCNNTLFSNTPTSATAGTTFAWSRAATVGINNAANNGTDDPTETLNNTTTDPIVVTYVYTLTANSCTNTQNVTVTVQPTPMLNSALTPVAICNNTTFNYMPTSATIGTVFNWSRAAVAGITNTAAAGSDDPNEVLDNNTVAPVDVTYVFTLAANSCNNTDSATVTINPTPTVNSVANQTVCNTQSVAAINFVGTVSGTTYTWTNSNSTIGLASTGTGDIATFTGMNPGNNIDTAIITVLPTANGCYGPTGNFMIIVNPTSHINAISDQQLCNGFATTTVVFGSNVAGSSYNFTNDNSLIGLALSGSTSSIPSFPATNTGISTLVSTVVVTPTANGCTGVADTFTYTVTPTPTVNAVGSQLLCNTDTTIAVNFTGAVAGTVYNWGNSNSGIGLASTGAGDIASFTSVNTSSIFDTATITVTPAIGTCIGSTQSLTIVVKPTPNVDPVSNQVLCNNTVTTGVIFTGLVSGTANNWTNTTTTIGLAASGIGNISAFGAINTTTAPITANVTVTPSANGCVGAAQSFSFTVNPTPKLTTSLSGTVCSGAPFNYTPACATTGTSFAWTRAATGGLSNAAGTSSGSAGIIYEVLNNITLAPKLVTYHYILSANACANNQNLLVTVNPAPVTPVIATMPTSSLCRDARYQNFGAATNAPDTVQYTWSATGATVFAQGAGHKDAIVNFPNAGIANVILTANATGFACNTSDTLKVTVSGASAINPEIYYVHDHFICIDNTVDSYQWGFDDASSLDSTIYSGQVDQNFYQPSPDFTNKKYWVMTTKGGCGSKTYYNAPTGVTTVGLADVASVNVFPNPTSDNAVVEVSGLNDGTNTVELTDITGKVIATEVLVDGKTVLIVNRLASGIYVVSCYHNGVKVGTTKLVRN